MYVQSSTAILNTILILKVSKFIENNFDIKFSKLIENISLSMSVLYTEILQVFPTAIQMEFNWMYFYLTIKQSMSGIIRRSELRSFRFQNRKCGGIS